MQPAYERPVLPGRPGHPPASGFVPVEGARLARSRLLTSVRTREEEGRDIVSALFSPGPEGPILGPVGFAPSRRSPEATDVTKRASSFGSALCCRRLSRVLCR